MDERERVLEITQRHKRRHFQKARECRNEYKVSGSREADEKRIIHECVYEALKLVGDEVERGG